MSRDLLLYLRDIRQHCDEIADHIAGLDVEAFARDRTRYKAVVFSLLVIGEAAKQVPPEWRARYVYGGGLAPDRRAPRRDRTRVLRAQHSHSLGHRPEPGPGAARGRRADAAGSRIAGSSLGIMTPT